MELEMIECPRCGQPFPKLRKEKFGYNFCIKCSEVGPKMGIVTVNGEGDHTWNDIVILEQEDARKFERKLKEVSRIKKDWEIEPNNVDLEEDEILVEPLTMRKVVTKLDEEEIYDDLPEDEEEEVEEVEEEVEDV